MPSLSSIIGAATPVFAWAPKGYREMIAKPRFKHLSMWGVRAAVLRKDQLDWSVLAQATEAVNRSAVYAEDEPGKDVWGPWRLVDGLRVGDCDDYAVHKLQYLLRCGLPRGALRLAVCRVGYLQEYHCVLLVYLDDGDAVILDNRTEGLWRKSRVAGYTWVSEEYPGHDFWWRKLS